MADQVAVDASPWLEAVPLRQTLRYGENPHQKARWFSHPSRAGVVRSSSRARS